MTDPFEELELHIVAARRAQMRASEKRAERKRAKELDDRGILFKQWTKWHAERKVALLAGAWSEPAQELAGFLEQMDIEDAPELLLLVKRGPWRETDADTRFLVLELISHSIVYLREREGMVPFDDPLPFSDDDPNVFLIIRELLR